MLSRSAVIFSSARCEGQAQLSNMEKHYQRVPEDLAPDSGKRTALEWKIRKGNGEPSLARKKKKRKRNDSYLFYYTAESSFMTLNQGWPSSNFSATSAGNSASLGGCIKRLRDQWSGGSQGRPRAHTSLIQDSLRAIACLIKDPRESATRY